MPGSLFPRSSSLMPDAPETPQAPPLTAPRQVHFTPKDNDAVAGPSRERRRSPSPPSVDPITLTPRGVKSVRAAVDVFEDGAEVEKPDYTLMLPREPASSPASSPIRAGKKQGRALDGTQQRPVSASPESRKQTQETGEANPADAERTASPSPPTPSRKGKERAVEGDLTIAHLDPNASSVIYVRGKERELDQAREAQAQREHEREHGEEASDAGGSTETSQQDKDRIQKLVDEIAMLKAEVRAYTIAFIF
jgi:hypothetical protein